jgi:hypothetical protein
MAAKTLVVLSMAAAVTVAEARPVYSQDTRGHTTLLDVSVIVRLDNNAGVPDQILRFAKARTARIYRRMGVSLAWLDAHEAIRQAIRPPYTMVLMTRQVEKGQALSEGVTDDVMGQAVPAVRRAHVFYERVMAKVSLPHRDSVTLLGYAMAHELGHLMLPSNSHSTTGVMRPNFDTDPRLTPSFTKAEATAIRRRLSDDERTWDFKTGTRNDTRLQPLRAN